jgi:hypothetical protein
VEHDIGEEERRRWLTAVDTGAPAKKFTRRVPKLKRGVQAGGKQLLAVDNARGGSGGRRCNTSARGGANGVG